MTAAQIFENYESDDSDANEAPQPPAQVDGAQKAPAKDPPAQKVMPGTSEAEGREAGKDEPAESRSGGKCCTIQ